MSVSKETKPFDYCSSPDGEDVLQKFGVIAKPVALTAFAFSTIDVMLHSHPKGYMQTIARYCHCSWPIFGAATAFVIGSNLAGSLRKKDDRLNWFIGGASAGAIAGIWRKNTLTGCIVATFAGIVALSKKHCIMNGTHLLYPKEYHVQYGGLRTVRQDWTLTKHRPGNWTTGEN
ncbi:uncharacterized protein LOC123010470 [Tribolium madens]|uniref:uncharacterized protein LOC123010470 n=1 Tax=Tribolium madens TaxID=41895 RepID=UPI001CF752A7|nr:uncharacterized protein LOC123010470 [Tribolium madens]